jgi:hypothetical protein
MESKLKNKKLLDEIEKTIDDVRNNQLSRFTGFQLQALLANMPQSTKNARKDKFTTPDGGASSYLSSPNNHKNKRRRERDILKKPKNIQGPMR